MENLLENAANSLELDDYFRNLGKIEKLFYISLIKSIKGYYKCDKTEINASYYDIIFLTQKLELITSNLNNIIEKNERCKKSSYVLGKEGENEIYYILNDLNLTVEKTFSRARSGDFVIKLLNNRQCH